MNNRIIFQIALLLILSISQVMPANYPFPQERKYRYGIKPDVKSQSVLSSENQAAFEDWKKRYYYQWGSPLKARIHHGKKENWRSTSEAIGWGMLVFVYMDNEQNKTRASFDALERYRSAKLNEKGLMDWEIDKYGNVTGFSSATEAELNMAWALIMADYQWGSSGEINYRNRAKILLSNIMVHEVSVENIILPGDAFRKTDAVNLCYFSPGYTEEFVRISGKERWRRVCIKMYEILNVFYEKNTIFPDWCTKTGAPYASRPYTFGYDAIQIPFKVIMDYCWYGTSHSTLARKIPYDMSQWLKNTCADNAKEIVDGYDINKNRTGNWNERTFVSCLGSAAMSDAKYQDWLNNCYDRLQKIGTGRYYADTVSLVIMLFMSGNLPVLGY
jgi:endo-1,4-beta-D-glucanase Y